MIETKNNLEEICLKDKQMVHVLLCQELDETLDLIELVKGLRRRGILSINGIVRVHDYIQNISDTSFLLFIASKDEYFALILKKAFRILGQRIKVISHDLIMTSAINSNIQNQHQFPIYLMICPTFKVLRLLLSDYLIMEMERLKKKVPNFNEIKGVIIPFYERKQKSRNFIFLLVENELAANSLKKHSNATWEDGRFVREAHNSILVISKSREENLMAFQFGCYNKMIMCKELDDINMISTQLYVE
ncbi:hypothetical protein PVAND_014234 [Polypedilum vanderplanki]|uniref:Uncharacterized protein n=1 Tax=Polypedilum vanderplanki TaxID=319348 RepID=A0A9J6CSZ7_POLVA|nr:hypothetical protein PVAND_014234 [Polypedilum vanderplanki]